MLLQLCTPDSPQPVYLGPSSQIDQIEAIQRPVTMEDGGPVLMDLLWSDPTTNDAVQGVQPSPRGPGLVTFGPDRVKEFCKVRSWHGGHANSASGCLTHLLGGVYAASACGLATAWCTFLTMLCPTRAHAEQRVADDCTCTRVRDGWL